MEYMDKLKDKLCKELDEYARKPDMSAGDLEAIHKLSDTIKNLDKIDMLEGDGEYSQRGYSRDGNNSYARGSSYANRGMHYVRGHYSRDGYSNEGRRGGYSRHDAKEAMMNKMEDLMDDAENEREREIIRRAMSQLENV